jgi:hypothetical protein
VSCKQLTDDELGEALAMLDAGATAGDLAEKFSISRWRFFDRRLHTDQTRGKPPHPEWFALVEKRQGRRVHEAGDWSISEKEIDKRCRRLRQYWTPEEEQQRRVGAGPHGQRRTW